MQLAVTTNIDQVFAQMDRFVEQAQAVAVPRALNKLRDQAQTAGLRRISEIYRIGPRKMEKYLSVKVAAGREFEASIIVRGAGFPLYEFSPRQTRAGVSVLVKGRRVVVPHAFIGSMPSGHIGVFARGSYGSRSRKFVATGQSFGRFRFSKTRLSINELYTMSPAATFSNGEVTDAMHDRMRAQAASVLAREIAFASIGR